MDHWSHMDSFTMTYFPSTVSVPSNVTQTYTHIPSSTEKKTAFSPFTHHCIVSIMLSKFSPIPFVLSSLCVDVVIQTIKVHLIILIFFTLPIVESNLYTHLFCSLSNSYNSCVSYFHWLGMYRFSYFACFLSFFFCCCCETDETCSTVECLFWWK